MDGLSSDSRFFIGWIGLSLSLDASVFHWMDSSFIRIWIGSSLDGWSFIWIVVLHRLDWSFIGWIGLSLSSDASVFHWIGSG